jgi:hypothetical protein
MNIGFLYLLLSFSPIKVCHSFFIFPLSFCSSWFLFVLFCGYLLKLWKFDFGTWYYLWTMISVRVKKMTIMFKSVTNPLLFPLSRTHPLTETLSHSCAALTETFLSMKFKRISHWNSLSRSLFPLSRSEAQSRSLFSLFWWCQPFPCVCFHVLDFCC